MSNVISYAIKGKNSDHGENSEKLSIAQYIRSANCYALTMIHFYLTTRFDQYEWWSKDSSWYTCHWNSINDTFLFNIATRFQRSMSAVEYFWSFINGFYILKQFPVMWLTFKMCLVMFLVTLINFVLAIALNDFSVIVWGSWILLVLGGYFAYKWIDLYRQYRKTRSN